MPGIVDIDLAFPKDFFWYNRRMIAYQARMKKLSGTSYSELIKQARRIFHDIERQSKRKAYIRSAYFSKEKIFFDYFWEHLNQKRPPERIRRLRFFSCAIELIQNSRHKPKAIHDPQSKHVRFHRFAGVTKENELFYVQVKEDLKTKQKHLISVFPED